MPAVLVSTLATSYGHEGSVSEPNFAQLAPRLGGVYAYSGLGASIGGGTGAVTLASGYATAYGHETVIPAQTVTLPVPSSGTVWYLIFVEHDWTPAAAAGGGAATLNYVAVGSTAVMPTLNINPGAKVSQPLWLAACTAGKTAVQSLVDVRRQDAKLVVVQSDKALPTASGNSVALVSGSPMISAGGAWKPLFPRPVVTNTVDPSVQGAVGGTEAHRAFQLSIPDPGFPYRIRPSGQMELSTPGRVNISVHLKQGGSVVQVLSNSAASKVDAQNPTQIPPRPSTAPVVGASVLEVWCQRYGTWTGSWTVTSYNGNLTAELGPA